MPCITVGKENSGNIDLYYEDHARVSRCPNPRISTERCFLGEQIAVLLAAVTVSSPMIAEGWQSSQPTTGYNYDTLRRGPEKLVTQLELPAISRWPVSPWEAAIVARYFGKYGSRA